MSDSLHHRPEPDNADFRPKGMLPPKTLVKLTRLTPIKWIKPIVFDYLLIAFAIVLCESFWHPAVYILAVMTIGARQYGIASISLHEGLHGTLLKNRRWNDFLGRLKYASVLGPVVIGYQTFREHHLSHHANTNDHHDPDIEMMVGSYEAPRWKMLLTFAAALSGVLFIFVLIRCVIKNLTIHPMAALILAATIGALAYGISVGFYPAVLFVLYWVIPLGTWGLFTNLVRVFAEHYPANVYQRGEEHPRVFRTREMLTSWFDKAFMVTRNLNYHATHHLYQQIPFYNLPEAHRELMKSEVYRQYAHVTHGYHRFLWEYFFQRDRPVGRVGSGMLVAD